MSKVGDIKKMYGQDFSVLVTNAPAEVINNYTTYSHGPKLLSNILLISSPIENGEDNHNPTLFVTDYNGEPLQLTYSVSFGNGLKLNEQGNISISIDNQTLKTSNNSLYVNTKSLDIIGNNKLGIAKIGDIINRNNGNTTNYPNNTYINTDNNGTLYLSTSFFDWLEDHITEKINNAIRPLINNNLSAWILYTRIAGDSTIESRYNNNSSIQIDAGIINSDNIILNFDFYYKSTVPNPEEVEIQKTGNYPILAISDSLTSNVIDSETIGDVTVFTHLVNGVQAIFYPNLNLTANGFQNTEYLLTIKPQSWTDNIFSLSVLQNRQDNPINPSIYIDIPNTIIINAK